MNQAVAVSSTSNLQCLTEQLESMTGGEDAVDARVGYGPSVIPVLVEFLLCGKHRTIAIPRCRLVRGLGLLGSQQTVLAFFKGYKRPERLSVLFAEDVVRSTAALKPSRWKNRRKHKQFFALWLQLKNPNREGSRAVVPLPLCRISKKCFGRPLPIKE